MNAHELPFNDSARLMRLQNDSKLSGGGDSCSCHWYTSLLIIGTLHGMKRKYMMIANLAAPGSYRVSYVNAHDSEFETQSTARILPTSLACDLIHGYFTTSVRWLSRPRLHPTHRRFDGHIRYLLYGPIQGPRVQS